MPACFQLIPKGEKEPRKLQLIDDLMREHFGAAPDPDRWYCHWYDIIGFKLALGRTWEQIHQDFDETAETSNYKEEYVKLHEIARYLEETYDPNVFHSRY